MSKGLLMVHTGDGKGKTTAALGLMLRTLGHGLRVCVIQFIKGSRRYGELTSAGRFEDLLDWHVVGKGFTWKSKDLEADRQMAREGWQLARDAIGSERYRLVILDELTYPIKYGMVAEDEVVRFLAERPGGVHVVVTGRNAPESLLDVADTVTEMKAVKHHYRSGVKAQRGIEF